MPQREITLDTAAFLDSPQAAALADVEREDVHKITDRFLACCYDEIGKAPRHLDGDDLHGIVGHLLPGQFARKDPLAEHVPAVLLAYLEFLGERAVISQMYELRRALEGTLDEFAHAVRTGEHAHHGHHAHRAQPFVHGAPKTGRNDPCPCGSGKKFKKCHGKA